MYRFNVHAEQILSTFGGLISRKLLETLDSSVDRQRGSHRIWYSPKGMRISIQTRGNRAKGYQVEQFLKVYEEESSNDG